MSANATDSMYDRNVRDQDLDSDSDGDGAEEILEESPCKRWSKRREEVKQRDVPGIDFAFLAMDNETGNEVVWNEVLFSERKNFRAQEAKINAVFDNLTHLVHTNLVKFHKYWTDAKSEKPRIIFITEYMACGSLARFLQRTRKSGSSLSLKAWKKWTTQILSALNYLHSCSPPIVHANLTCNTMFIQHNGLIKIGCVAPNAIHHHVKTFRENLKNMHYVAPEYEHCTAVAPPADIYSFGVCALEMTLPVGLGSCVANGSTESTSFVTPEVIRRALDSITDPMQKDFIESCLNPEPSLRPSARQLLFHTVLFEVHSLKLLAAHRIVASRITDSINESDLRVDDNERVAASCKFRELAYCQVPAFQVDLDKFIEEVGNGIYPLTAFAPLAHQPKMAASTSSAALASDYGADHSDFRDRPDPTPSPSGEPLSANVENRTIVKLGVSINGSLLTVMMQLDDLMNRQLTTEISANDTAITLSEELVRHGLIAETDEKRVSEALAEALEMERLDRESPILNPSSSSAGGTQTDRGHSAIRNS